MVRFKGIVADRVTANSAFGRRRKSVLTIRCPDGGMVKVIDAPFLEVGDSIYVECEAEHQNGFTTYRVSKLLNETPPEPKPKILEW